MILLPPKNYITYWFRLSFRKDISLLFGITFFYILTHTRIIVNHFWILTNGGHCSFRASPMDEEELRWESVWSWNCFQRCAKYLLYNCFSYSAAQYIKQQRSCTVPFFVIIVVVDKFFCINIFLSFNIII